MSKSSSVTGVLRSISDDISLDLYKSIENSFNIYWKLKAVDSIGISNEIPKEEYSKIVDALIDSYKIKDILTNRDKAKQETAGQFRTTKSAGATNNHNGA